MDSNYLANKNNVREKMTNDVAGSTLKLIAIITMLIDHIGAAILERYWMVNGYDRITSLEEESVWVDNNAALYYSDFVIRSIGRIAFPIFCYLLVEGFYHTRSKAKYALRLFIFALLSDVPFDLAFKGKLTFENQNVYFTLLFGLLCIWLVDIVVKHFSDKKVVVVLLSIPIVVTFMTIALLCRTDYSACGVATIFALYSIGTAEKKKNKKPILSFVIGVLILSLFSSTIEIFALVGLVFICRYEGRRGLKLKYVFYLFYPLHLTVLYLIAYFLGISGVAL